MALKLKLDKVSWALYDFANTIFAMNIVSIYFVLWLTIDKKCPELYYSLALGGSIFLAAIAMPVLGEISDKLKKRIPFLIIFTLGCVFFTILLGIVRGIFSALLFFAAANFCYQLAGVIYNSLLAKVSTPQTMGRVSALGVSLGYLGALCGLHFVRPFLTSGGKQAVFIPTAGLFLLFALPSFFFIKDAPSAYIPKTELKLKTCLKRVYQNLLDTRQNPSLVNFLIGAFLCLNAVNTIIIFMGVYTVRVMSFNQGQIIYFISLSTIFAIAGSYFSGFLTDKWGSKRTLLFTIKLWCVTILLACIAFTRWIFWVAGPLSGICLGATWVCSRTMLLELIPKEKAGQMFGLLGITSKLSAILGPVVWGVIVNIIFPRDSAFKYRIALFSVFLFMFCGLFFLKKIKDPRV